MSDLTIWIDERGSEQERLFQAGRGRMADIVIRGGGRQAGRTQLIEARLRRYVAEHGTKSVLICSTAPAAVALGQELGVQVVDPKVATPWRSILDWPQQ